MKVNILGTKYTITEKAKNKDKVLAENDGYCDTSVKKIIIDEMKQTEVGMKENLQQYKESVLRHEITHALLYESGMDACSWAKNEELVDWIAIQFPKMLKAFTDAKCI